MDPIWWDPSQIPSIRTHPNLLARSLGKTQTSQFHSCQFIGALVVAHFLICWKSLSLVIGGVLAIGISPDSFIWVFEIHQMKYLVQSQWCFKDWCRQFPANEKKEIISSASVLQWWTFFSLRRKNRRCFELVVFSRFDVYSLYIVWFLLARFDIYYIKLSRALRSSHQHKYKSVELYMYLFMCVLHWS